MQKKICIAQNVEELKFILEKSGKKILVLPINLETFLYCVSEKLNFINHAIKIASFVIGRDKVVFPHIYDVLGSTFSQVGLMLKYNSQDYR